MEDAIGTRKESVLWLVELGMNPKMVDKSHYAREPRADSGSHKTDKHGVPYLNVRKHRPSYIPHARTAERRERVWYYRCRQPDYFTGDQKWEDMTQTEKISAKTVGLPGSEEWYSYRTLKERSPFCVLAKQELPYRPRSISIFNANLYKRRDSPFNKYTVVWTRDEFIDLHLDYPPANRHFQEVIFPYTPHKFVMDIEKDFTDVNASMSEFKNELEELRRGLRELFVPLLCRFFLRVFGLSVAPQDCYVSDSSRIGVKFSAHLIVTTPQIHYFDSRLDEWVAMVLLAEFLKEESNHDPDLKSWLFYINEKNETQTLIDFSVYGKGTRNFRTIGSCKISCKNAGKMWKDCRVFLPIQDQESCPFDCFLSTVSGIPENERTRIVISPAHIDQACEFAEEMRSQRPQPAWFRNSLGLARNFRVPVLSRPPPELRPSRVTTRAPCTGTSVPLDPPPFTIDDPSVTQDQHNVRLWYELHALRCDAEPEFPVLVESYLQTVEAHLVRLAQALHPENSVSCVVHTLGVSQYADRAVVMHLNVNTFRNGRNRDDRRLCFIDPLNCTGGTHQARLSIRPDLTVTYHCYACLRTETVHESPNYLFRVIPVCRVDKNIPVDFRSAELDYATIPPPSTQPVKFRNHMRPIRPLPSGRYLDDLSTIVLRGAMGSGKTHTIREFLSKCEKEKPDLSVLALSFRRALARMFADSFNLTMYSEVNTLSLFEHTRLAIQLESLERLARFADNGTQPGKGEVALTFRMSYDVVIIDEIESVLAHFDSCTLSSKLSSIWAIFQSLCIHAKCLVVADADIGTATYTMIRVLRHPEVQSSPDNLKRPLAEFSAHDIQNLQYHVNPFVAIKTRFLDYLSQEAWYEALIARLLQGKNVFVFSNSKRINKGLEVNIKKRLLNEMTVRDPNDPVHHEANIAASKILLLDSNMAEREKRNMARCNEVWTKYRVVIVSPVLGAGIDFTAKHFHCAFGTGIPYSCTARALHQIRGRVRYLLDEECHMHIRSGLKEKEPSEMDHMVDDVRQEAPVTLQDARISIETNLSVYLSNMSVIRMQMLASQNLAMICVPRTDPLLLEIRALNLLQNTKSRRDFHGEFIRLAREATPYLDYEFIPLVNEGRLRSHETRMSQALEEAFDHESQAIACCEDLDPTQTEDLARADAGRGDFQLAGPNEPRQNALNYYTIRRNAFRHFYGIPDGVNANDIKVLYEHMGEEREVIATLNFTMLLGMQASELLMVAKLCGEMEPMILNFLDGEGRSEEMRLSERANQLAHKPQVYDRYRLLWLLYLAGGDLDCPAKIQRNADDGKRIIDRVLRNGFHSALKEVRLLSPEGQEWAKNNFFSISQDLGIELNWSKMRKDHVPDELAPGTWLPEVTTRFLSEAITRLTGLEWVSANGKRRRMDVDPSYSSSTTYSGCMMQLHCDQSCLDARAVLRNSSNTEKRKRVRCHFRCFNPRSVDKRLTLARYFLETLEHKVKSRDFAAMGLGAGSETSDRMRRATHQDAERFATIVADARSRLDDASKTLKLPAKMFDDLRSGEGDGNICTGVKPLKRKELEKKNQVANQLSTKLAEIARSQYETLTDRFCDQFVMWQLNAESLVARTLMEQYQNILLAETERLRVLTDGRLKGEIEYQD